MPKAERAAIQKELSPAFTVSEPTQQTTPFVFCSPHSGRIYPKHFLKSSRLDPHALRKSEDCYVDDLFADVTELGAPLISARFPRAYLDVNREPFELDPQLFGSQLPPFANAQSMRVAGGLGTIARIVADGENIYHTPPSIEAAFERIELLYRPFHVAIANLLDRTRSMFGTAILIDCHSMPSAAMSYTGQARPDFVVGDRFGASCDPMLTRLARDEIGKLGYKTLLNRPYAGGFITEHYGRPQNNVHALQIEINRSLYLDETSLETTPGYSKLRKDLLSWSEQLFAEFKPSEIWKTAAE